MKRTVIGIAVCGVVIALIILLRARPTGPPTATLSDGTQIIVQAVTYGTNHVFVHGSKLLNTIHRFVPNFISVWLPPTYAGRTTTSDERLMVWYSAFDPSKRKYLATPSVDRFTVIDEHGCTFPLNQYGGSQTTPTFSIASAHVRVFPRRQQRFTLRAKFMNHPPIDLQVSNPLLPATTEWTPEPLPATGKTDDLAVTLTKLRIDEASTYVAADFDIYQDGVYRNEWYSPVRNFRDATGNSSDNPLCVYERAWKLEVDLYKTAKAPFAESNIWRIPNLVVPKSGEVQVLTNEAQIAGLSLIPTALCGSGHFVFSNDVCVSSTPSKDGENESFSMSSSGREVRLDFRSRNPSLIVRVDGWRRAEELLLRAQASDGRLRSIHFRGSADRICRFEMDKASPGQMVHLEFIPQEPVRFEFLVQPPQP